MSDDVEIEVRNLLRSISNTATRRGGMSAATYEALMAASAALSSAAMTQEQQSRLALSEARSRLQACKAAYQAKAA